MFVLIETSVWQVLESTVLIAFVFLLVFILR